jgi:hypothetical protein
MKTTARTSTLSALVAAFALGLAGLAASTAAAETGEEQYDCQFFVGNLEEDEGTEGEGIATASFDTAIADGLVVDIGQRVMLEPFTGTIALPEGFVTMLRANGFTSMEGVGNPFLLIEQAEEELSAYFEFGPVDLPGEGGLTLEVSGEADSYRVQDEGVHSILLPEFHLFLNTNEGQPDALISCFSEDDIVVDAFTARQATVAPAPTVTVTTSVPVRPVLVQTDATQGDSAAIAPALGATGLLALAAAAIGLGRARHPSPRRH